ncbi:hypothetical protein [Nocardia blacklockiae]|uniref:hypothetical protein n=1 Tax=Nocardia blacklockiae TaxID=480036 RepID=UPI001892E0B0|nr:hypothetical protein [Nocardia blacklockiae]MBF6170180.1 hypothetical protein [Nocardia blacklockiae]
MLGLEIVGWGLVAGVVNTVAMAVLYGNPWVARVHAAQGKTGAAGAGRGGSRGLGARLLGDQLEVYVITVGYAWLHPLLPWNSLVGALALATLFAALRVCAPVWALWTQGTYSGRYLAVEVAAGLVSSLVIVLVLLALF